MSKISIYDVVPVPKLADKLIGTSVGGDPEDLTYNFTLGELLNLFIPNIPGNTLQGVLDFGNTATQDINLTGTITTTTLNVGNTANILDSNLTGQTHITGGLYDRLNSIGTAGQVLKSTGTQVEWFTIPTVIPNLQQVLASGNTAVNNIILTGNLSANNAALLTSTISTSLTLLGTLRDGLSSVGTNNQVLSSNVTGVRWVNLPVYSAASPLLYNSGTGVFSIQQANASQDGYLSAADWITFDGKQTAISLTTTGNSGPSTLIGSTINVPNYTLAGLNGVPQTRTLTINGVTYNLSADRSWTIAAGVSSVSATTPLFSSGGANPNITIQQSSSSLDGYLSSVDWLTFNNKQAFLGGTGLVKSVGGTISYITDNSSNWNTAYNDSIVSAAVTGTVTKTLTLNQQDGGTITASWSDIDTGLTSVGVSMPTAFTVTNSPLTSNGTIAITGSGNTLQYIDGTGALQTFPSLTGFVPYTGATGSVNLGVYSLTATSLIKNGGTSGQFLKADGSVDSSAYIVLGSLSASAPLSYNNLTGAFSISQSGAAADGYLSSTDWSIFNSKQDALTLTTTGTSGPSTLIGSTLNIPQYTDQFVGTVTSVAALTLGTIGTDLSSTVANSTTTPVITLNVPTASAVNRGALSSADWTTFNNKQPAGNYITSLTGEATASGPGAAAVTLDNAAVTGKVLTGLNVTGGTVLAADSILIGFGKVQNQINGLIGGSIFQGVWNANTNTPALVSSVGTNGHYYIVSVAGTTNLDGITDWQVGDWAIFAGTTWEKVDNTDSVSSVNGFTGAVSLTTDNIPEGATNLYFTNTRARTAISLTTTGSSGASTYDNTTGVFNIPTYTDQFVGTVTSVGLSSATSGVTIGSTPVTTSGTITLAIATASGSQNGLLSSTDWTTFNSKQGAITLTTTGTSGASTLVGNTLNIPNYADQFVGTVTSVSFTLGSTGTNLSASVANSTTTPAITLNVPTASASARGALSSTDWTTFNNKQDAITLTTTGTSGAATLVGATLNIPQYQAAGTYVTSVTATSPLFSSGGTTPNITIQQASGSQSGFLSSTDWTTFNSKQNALTNPVTGTGTTNYLPKFTGASTIGNSNIISDSNGTFILGGTSSTGTAGTGSGRGNLILAGSTSNKVTFNNDSTTVNGYVYSDGSELQISSGAGYMNFYAGNTEAMRIFSGQNVHIGPTPASDNGARLQVSGTATFSDTVTFNGSNNVIRSGNELRFNRTDNLIYTRLYDAGSTFALDNRNGNGFSFQDAGTPQMTITSSGNLGLGVTPSAWGSLFAGGVLQVKNSSLLGYSNNTYLNTNAYYTNAGDFYIENGFASRYVQRIGQHQWETAPSGTAGGTISFTQAMTLTSGGNLILTTGTVSDNGARLQVSGTAGAGITLRHSNGNVVALLEEFSGVQGAALTLKNSSGTNNIQFNAGGVSYINGGNVGIGIAIPASLLTINGTSANTESGQIRIIKTGANEQTLHIGYNTTSDYAYLNAYKAGLGYKPIALNPDGGNVLIGTVSDNGARLQVSGKLTVTHSSTDFVTEIINTASANPYGLRVKDASGAANNYPLFSVSNNAGSVEYFRVNSGTGTATFSSSVTSNATTSVSFYSGTYVSNTLGDGSFATYSGRIRENLSYGLNIDLYDRTAATWRTPLSFNNTGGAATFSSSVTANGGLISNGGSIGYGGGELGFNVTTSGATSGIYTTATGSPILYFDHRATGNTGFWVWRSGTGGGTTALTLSNVGAATFSSSVNVGGAGAGSTLNVKGNASNSQLEIGNLANGTNYIISYDRIASTYRNLLITTNASDNALFINTSGNVGIGTTSPSAKLQITSTSAGAATVGLFLNNNSTTLNTETRIAFAANANDDIATNRYSYISALNTSGSNGQALIFATNETGAAATERMRIHQTTNGGYFKASNNGVYQNAGSTGSYHEINQSLDNTESLVVSSNGNSSPYGMSVWFPNADPNNATNWSYAAFTGTSPFITIYKIFSNGTVAARSDARWKKNIETTRNGYIDDLCKLRVVKYNWYNHEDDAPKELGLIAQEVEEVFPNLINIEPIIAKREVEQEDGTIIEEEFEDGVSRSVKVSVLPIMLLKAIQEQQEQIKELQVQIDKLKNT